MERLANPSRVRQAPDARALNKTTILKVESELYSTPPFAQEYFEPGVNTKLNRRTKPKTNYTLPSDLPQYPLGYVPTNKASGLAEDTPIIRVKESAPADLIEVFARINAEQQVLASQPKYEVDVGSMIMKEYSTALKDLKNERQREMMMAEGFTEVETEKAIDAVRMEAAMKKAKEPVKGVSVQTALAETFGIGVGTEAPSRGEIEVQTELSMEGGKEIYARKPRGTAEEVAVERAMAEIGKGTQASITKFFSKK